MYLMKAQKTEKMRQLLRYNQNHVRRIRIDNINKEKQKMVLLLFQKNYPVFFTDFPYFS
jgi:hypothetical protein